jgi:kynurenine formamidase
MQPAIPVWVGFKHPQQFEPAVNATSNEPFTYAKDGFEATAYKLSTDQYGSQLDPPAHWDPWYPGIDEIPATYAVRPLVVISIVHQVSVICLYCFIQHKSPKEHHLGH